MLFPIEDIVHIMFVYIHLDMFLLEKMYNYYLIIVFVAILLVVISMYFKKYEKIMLFRDPYRRIVTVLVFLERKMVGLYDIFSGITRLVTSRLGRPI